MAPLVVPHAEFDAAALEGRARRTGRAGQPVPIADDDLGVGADVHEQCGLFGAVHTRTHDAGHDVAAHVAGHGGKDQRGDVLAERQPQIDGLQGRKESGSGHIGRSPDVAGIDLEQQLRHGGVARQGDR